MGQFDEEIPKKSGLELLKSAIKTHEDNLRDLKQAIRMFSGAGEKVLAGYIHTLESDVLFMKYSTKKIENGDK